MNKKTSRLISMLTVLVMMLSMLPVTAAAPVFKTSFYDGIINADKALLVYASTPLSGTFTATWNNTSYTFTANENAFSTYDAAVTYAKANNIDTPDILVKSWTSGSDLTISTGCRVFAPNYNMRPYTVGESATAVADATKSDGSDWAYNSAYTANALTAGNIIIAAGTQGVAEVYGFTMSGCFKDNDRTASSGRLDIKLENILFDGSVTSQLLQIGNTRTGYINTTPSYAANTDSFELKNSYIKNTGKCMLFEGSNGTVPPVVTLDGVYVDGTTAPVFSHGANIWVNCGNYDTDISFTIKNSNLRNLNTSKLYFEGTRVGTTFYKRSFNIENTILKDVNHSTTDGKNGVFRLYIRYYTHVLFSGNHVISENCEGQQILLTNIYSGNQGSNLRVDICNNLLNGATLTGIYTDTNSPASYANIYIYKNYYSPAYYSDLSGVTGQPLNLPDNDKYCSSYYLDSNMTVLDIDLDIADVSFYDDVDYVSIDNKNNTVSIGLASGSFNPGFEFNADVTTKFRSAGGTVITSVSAPATDAVSTYYLDVASTLVDYSRTYTVKVYGKTSADSFESAFTDATGTIDTSRAYLYDPSASGTSHLAKFGGVSYSFTVGTNAFSTLSDLFAKAKSDGITPQILLADKTYDTLTLTAAAEVYGANYATSVMYGEMTELWRTGTAWASGAKATVGNVSVSADITVSGVQVGTVTDANTTAKTIKIKNSIIIEKINAKPTSTIMVDGCKIDTDGQLVQNTAASVTVTNTYSNNNATGFVLVNGGTVTLKNNRFEKVCTDGAFITAASGSVIENNVFTGSSTALLSVSGTFKNNRVIGFNAPGCAFSYNYYADYTDNYIYGTNGNVPAKDVSPYYIDYALTTLNTDIEMTGASGADKITYDNVQRTVSFEMISCDASGVVLTFPESVTYNIYNDAECTDEVLLSDIKHEKDGPEFYTFYIKAQLGKNYIIYTLSVRDKFDEKDFENSYTDAIIKSTALLVDSASSSANTDERYYTNWQEKEYFFIKDKNVFETVDDALSYAKSKNIDTPDILLLDASDDIIITMGCRVFAPDYDTAPFTKGSADDGSDWAVNSAWTGAVTVDNVIIGADVTGKVELYGLTISGCLNDTARAVGTDLDITIKNIKFTTVLENKEYSNIIDLRNANNKIQSETARGMQESFIATNVHLAISGTIKTLFGANGHSNLPAYVTLDSWWFDASSVTVVDYTDLSQIQAKSNITIKNCNFRNWYRKENYGALRFTSYACNNNDGGVYNFRAGAIEKSVTIQNNILYNVAWVSHTSIVDVTGNKWGVFGISYGGYTDIEITSNRIILQNSDISGANLMASTYHSSTIQDENPLTVTIKNNYLNGIMNKITVWQSTTGARKSAVTFGIDKNYTTDAYTAAPGTGVPLTAYAVSDYICASYFLDPAMTILSNQIVDMTFDGGVFDDNETLNVAPDVSTVDITEHIDNTYNKLYYFADSRCETQYDDPTHIVVGSVGTAVYVKIYSHDESESVTKVVNIVKEDGFAVDNVKVDNDNDAGEGFKWLSWRGIVTATGTQAVEVTVSGEMDHTVGTIYLSSDQNLETVKASLRNGLDDIDGTVENINAWSEQQELYTSCVYVMSNPELTWDDTNQRYTYRYNFRVGDGKTRATVMFAIYTDENGQRQISFSDMVIQNS